MLGEIKIGPLPTKTLETHSEHHQTGSRVTSPKLHLQASKQSEQSKEEESGKAKAIVQTPGKPSLFQPTA